MTDQRQFTLRQVDQARTDFALIESNLEFGPRRPQGRGDRDRGWRRFGARRIRFPLTIEPHGEFAAASPRPKLRGKPLTTIPANELCEPPGPGDGISYSPFSAC